MTVRRLPAPLIVGCIGLPSRVTFSIFISFFPILVATAAGLQSVPRDMLRLTRATGREPLDVFFSPSVYTYFPLPPRLPAVVTIHDAIAERFPHLTLPSARARLFWKLKVKLLMTGPRPGR